MTGLRETVIDEMADLPDFPPRSSIPYLALYLSRLMTADYLGRITGTGIAPAQAFVLRELWRAEPLSQVEISQRLDIGKATVGQTLKRLERSGLIERRRSAEDGRVIVVQLTAKGRALREPLARAARDQVSDIIAMLGQEEANTLSATLARLVDLQRRRLKQRGDDTITD